MTPNHCSGFTCTDVISCDATRSSSYEVYMFIMVIGSLVCGTQAVSALMNKYPKETYNFAFWLLTVVVLTAIVTVWDLIYEEFAVLTATMRSTRLSCGVYPTG